MDVEDLISPTTSRLGGTPYTSTFGYNQDDLPLTVTLHSGSTQAQETGQYDADGRLVQVSAMGPTGVAMR
jgi:hypothetical protein